MGLFDALNTAVSGLNSQSYSLQNISGNIANSQTTAFKRIDTRFQDLMGDNLPSKQIAGGVLASSAPTNNVQGDIQNSTTSTFMAVNGNGYFIVQKPTSFSGSVPVFGGVNLYTRRGDFQPDQNGYMVNGSGYYLMGTPLDPTTGMPTGSIPVPLQFSNNLIPAQQTSQITYNANLPSQPITVDTKTGVPGSNLLNPAIFASNPLVTTPTAARIQGTGAAITPTIVTGTVALTFPLAAGGTISINGTTVTTTAGQSAAQLLADINGVVPGVTASLNGTNHLVLTGDAKNALTLADGAPVGTLAALGFTAGTTGPTNIVTAAGLAGDELIVNIGSLAAQTITFGNNPGQVSTLAQLETALKALPGVAAGSTTVDNNGNITIVGANTTDVITVSCGPIGVTNFLPTFGIANAQGYPSNGHVYGIDQTNFLNETVAGGSITAYDGTGTPVDMQFRWAKVDSSSLGAGHTDQWNMFYQTNSNATNTQQAWTNVGTNFYFNSTGQLTPSISQLTLSNVTVNGQSLGNVALVFGSNGLTQFSNTSGTVQVNLLNQNGSAAGKLQSIAVDDQGRIIGTYSNGRTVPLAQVTLATFNGQNSLKQLDGGAYQATADSGPPLQNATGKIVGSSLEASNADIADEFSKLIVTQQAYSANTKIITTVNQMAQDLLNVIR